MFYRIFSCLKYGLTQMVPCQITLFSYKYLNLGCESKHMSTTVYLQHIHNHNRLAGQYTWLHLNRVCSNIHLCLSGTFHHWSLQRENTSKWTKLDKLWVPAGHSSFSRCSQKRVKIEKTETLETHLLGTRRQSGWPGPGIYPGLGKESWDIRSPQTDSEFPRNLKSSQKVIKRKTLGWFLSCRFT